MQAIGERLREARMRQGLDISELEASTKIRAKYLRALENDEFGMLPCSTYVKSFLRTYAEQLGLDAQLLVEEYRAQHEPRGEGELQAYVPPARREPAVGGGPPVFGPGTLIAGGVVLLLVVFAVIGLASGGKSHTHKAATAPKHKPHRARPKPRPQPAVAPTTVSLKVVPTESTYVCTDDGAGHTQFEGIINSPKTFSGKRVRLNLGRSSANLVVDGKPYSFTRTASAVGFDFSPGGKNKVLPPGQRPCGG